MKNYLIQFFYYTDLRADSVVAAQNELAALVLAMNKMKIEEWSVFYLDIALKSGSR